MKILKKILFFVVLFSMFSCVTSKFNGKKGAKKSYEVFFINQGVLQYFVKPTEFKANEEMVMIDFTFRDTLAYTSFVTVNYSIFSSQVIKQVDSAFFVVDNKRIKLENCTRFFIDLHKNTYQIRNSCGITYQELTDLFSSQPVFEAYYNNEKTVFIPTKKTVKIFSAIKTQIIDIIELNKD